MPGRAPRRASVFAVVVAVLLFVPSLPRASVAALTEISSKTTGSWSNAATWSCGCIPGTTHHVIVLAGHTVTVEGTVQAGKVTVEGTLLASRTASSTLTVSGNLIVEGLLDYGTAQSPIPAGVTARIRFVLNEATYVGGATMVPLDSDVGLWVIGTGKVTTKGPYRDGWSLLTASAAAASQQITVDSRFAAGWTAGDQVVIGPANVGAALSPTDELRTISAALGGGKFSLTSSLSVAHTVQSVTWTDAWDRSQTETLAPAVANLTRNIVFEAASLSHRPHMMIMDSATVQLEDLAVVGFSPVAKNLGTFLNGRKKPMGRYALHFHTQKDASRSSYVKRAVIRDGQGDGVHIHNSYGVVVEDTVVYNQARATNAVYHAVFLEGALDSSGNVIADTGANDAWLDRLLVMRWGQNGSGLVRSSGIWIEGGVGAFIVGAHLAGSTGTLSAGIHYPNCFGCENGASANPTSPERLPRILRATAHSVGNGFSWWQNPGAAQDVIDLLTWNNKRGIDVGAYRTTRKFFGVRAVGNSEAQLVHHTVDFAITDFLGDGQSKGGSGIIITDYTFNATQDAVYEMGLIRGTTIGARFSPCLQTLAPCGSATPWVQFSRVEFEGNPVISFIWHPSNATRLRFREQTGLLRPANFTLYRVDRTDIAGGVVDGVYIAIRVDNETTGAVAKPPSARMVSYSGCAADDAVMSGTVTFCAESDAPTVEFWAGKTKVATVTPGGVLAQATLNLNTWTYGRAYVYAKAIGANGRYTVSRVLRIRVGQTGVVGQILAPAGSR